MNPYCTTKLNYVHFLSLPDFTPKTCTEWNQPCRLLMSCDLPTVSGDSIMKKLGAKEKSRGANINVSPAWWFSVVMKIDLYQTQHRLVNIVRTVARKSSNRLKFCWMKVICCICQSNKLEREIKQKTEGISQNLEVMAYPGFCQARIKGGSSPKVCCA